MKFSYHFFVALLLTGFSWWSSPLSAQAPANDDLCNATALTLSAGCGGAANGDNTNATTETNEPFGTCFVSSNETVWYSFVASATGAVDITTDNGFGSNDDTEIALYELPGGNCADLTDLVEIDCNQDISLFPTNYLSSLSVAGLTPGTTYYVQVSGYQGTQGDFCITVDEFIPPMTPANDSLCDAVALTLGAGCMGTPNADNSGATTETNEPDPLCFSGTNNTIWYSFVAPASGNVEVSTDYAIGSNTDTEIAIYDLPGGNCNDLSTLVELGCDQDGGSVVNFNSIAQVTGLTGGTTYYIQASGYNGSVGDFCITVEEFVPATPPANDSLCDAVALTLGTGCMGMANADNTGATTETNEPSASCFNTPDETIWYSFVAPASGNVEVSTDYAIGSNTDTEIAIYDLPGGNCSDLSTLVELGCDQDGGSVVNFNSVAEVTGLTAGATYYIQASGFDGTQGDFCITVDELMPVSTGNNDTLCNATALTVGAGCMGMANGDNTGATTETNEPFGSCFVSPNTTVWFSFVAPASGAVEITTDNGIGSNNDTEVALYELPAGNCSDLSDLVQLACDQDIDAANQNFLSFISAFGLTPGTTYYLQVSGWLGTEGDFCITVDEAPAPSLPANDTVCNAINIPVDGSVNPFNNDLATLDPDELTVLPQPPGGSGVDNASWFTGDPVIQSSLWFSLSAPSSGRVFIDLCSHGQTDFDPQIALYSATDCDDYNTFSFVAANDDNPGGCPVGNQFSSAMEVSCLTPGQTYYLLVDGYADERGNFAIAISELPTTEAGLSILSVPAECGNDGVLLTEASGVPPFDYLWADGDTNIVRDGLAPGSYTLTISDGCDSVVTRSATVDGGMSMMVDAGMDTTVCDSAELTLGGETVAMGGSFPEEDRVYIATAGAGGVSFDVHKPHDPTVAPVAAIPDVSIFSGDFAFNHSVFFAMDVETDTTRLVAIDYQSGSLSTLGDMFPGTEESLTGMAFDDQTQTLYAIAYDVNLVNGASLYAVNTSDGAMTLAATFSNLQLPIWIAVDTAGQMYSMDIINDVVYSLDIAMGTATAIDTLPFNASFGQDADFDPNTNNLYFSTVNAGDGNAFLYGRYEVSTGGVYFMPGYTAQVGALGIRPAENAFTYDWAPGLGSLALVDGTVAKPTLEAFTTSPNSYVLTVTDGCGNEAKDTVAVNATVGFILDVTTTPQYGPGFAQGTATAVPAGGPPPYTYAWSNGETTSSVEDLTAGTYSVTVTDAFGCEVSADFEIADATGIRELGISELQVFPNPNQGIFEVNISMDDISEVALSLFNVRGQQVYQRSFNASAQHRATVDVSGMAKGIYMLRVQTENGQVLRRVVVK